MGQLKVFVSYRHLEVRVTQVTQPVHVIITDDLWQGARHCTLLCHTWRIIDVRLGINTVWLIPWSLCAMYYSWTIRLDCRVLVSGWIR